MNENIDISPLPLSKKTWKDFLLSPTVGKTLSKWAFGVLLANLISRVLMSFLLPNTWQISGYYLDGLTVGLLLLPAVLWLISIGLLFSDRQFTNGIGRLLVGVPVSLGFLTLLVFSASFLPSIISGWPLDYVYSPSRNRYYILAYKPNAMDAAYRIFSTSGSLLNPIWKSEFGEDVEYTSDGKPHRCSFIKYASGASPIENPHLILSKDEQLLVLGRGGGLTDALLLDMHQPLVESADLGKSEGVRFRDTTERIKKLLAEHDQPTTSPASPMSDSEIEATLESWCRTMEKQMIEAIPFPDGSVSFQIEEITRLKSNRIQVFFSIECQKWAQDDTSFHQMSVVQDGNRLIITRQETGLSGKVSAALHKIAGSGTYINPPAN